MGGEGSQELGGGGGGERGSQTCRGHSKTATARPKRNKGRSWQEGK